jgi:N6-L-threonylcarbamoyladenine synthase
MMTIGIETSCDDTCVAVLEIKNKELKILSNVISSQVKLHAKYGGVYPSLAKREHQKNLPTVFQKAIRGIDVSKINLIGVTIGPGLEPCLWQGVNFAKELAERWKKPIIPINHIEAHILTNFINLKSKISNLKSILPAICLVVSGGHTQLILMPEIGKYKLIGETRDDAAGECFDKVARILGLGYPGGPIVDQQAAEFKISNLKSKIVLPRPMIYQKNYDFSFSGLKTAVLYQYQKSKIKNKNYKRAMCAEVQGAIIDVLIHKTIKATKDLKAKSIILGGGVAASQELKNQFKNKCSASNLKFLVPSRNLCTDNAVMVAITAFFHKKERFNLQKIQVEANLRI